MPDTHHNRYARQIQYAPIGTEGQSRIEQSAVTILGCGALGSVAAEILARAGVGRLRLVDRDLVEWTNLQRQALFDEDDAAKGRAKVQAASERIAQINRSIQIEPLVIDVTAANIADVLDGSDLVIDAADNFAIRFLLNDWSLKQKTAWVHGGCIGASGQVCLFDGRGSPCFRCLIPEPPPAASVPTCDTAGVLGAATHMIASLQCLEATKWLSGNRDAVHTEVWSFDLWRNRFRALQLDPALSQSCRACAQHKYDFLDADHDRSGAVMEICGRDAVQITPATTTKIALKQVAQRWQDQGNVQSNPFFVRLTIPSQSNQAELRLTLFADGRAVIDGTEDASRARTLYDRFVGG
ncbi:thiamine/molybdopterin biosynthesis ThiF/MoeB-like protein [Rhodopirellula maiorica SM1]|uniref:Thiamine/molybdopterin biosynthesis ThiF/MoeB-like protein n=1 Tax=Rhodopirellula maiorica SM1 TaxID=1265738 RepID=M5RIW9_9BACT|nr:ThiF family adenylyltransferase [Rhodopirellula maiorica]EMI19263.1 thiamine/molybdopterin biosynthesis ThiF/MoeB-like protein [Rhodopirellula maiorica SM1]